MYTIEGAIVGLVFAAGILAIFAAGVAVGWVLRRTWDGAGARRASQLSEEEERKAKETRRKMEAAEEEFRRVMNYNAATAYGLDRPGD